MSNKEQRTRIEGVETPRTKLGQLSSGRVQEINMPVVASAQKVEKWGSLIGNIGKGLANIQQDTDKKQSIFDTTEGWRAGSKKVNEIIEHAETLTPEDRRTYIDKQFLEYGEELKASGQSESYFKSAWNTYTSKLANYDEKYIKEERTISKQNYFTDLNQKANEMFDSGAGYEEVISMYQNGRYKMTKKESGSLYLKTALAHIKEKQEDNPSFDWKSEVKRLVDITTKDGIELASNLDYSNIIDNGINYLQGKQSQLRNTQIEQIKVLKEQNYKETLVKLYDGQSSLADLEQDVIGNAKNFKPEQFKGLMKELKVLKNIGNFSESSNPEIYSAAEKVILKGKMTDSAFEVFKSQLSKNDYIKLRGLYNNEEDKKQDFGYKKLQEGINDIEKTTINSLVPMDEFGNVSQKDQGKIKLYSEAFNEYITNYAIENGKNPPLSEVRKISNQIVVDLNKQEEDKLQQQEEEEQAIKDAKIEQDKINEENDKGFISKTYDTVSDFVSADTTKTEEQETKEKEDLTTVQKKIYEGSISEDQIKKVEGFYKEKDKKKRIKVLKELIDSGITNEELKIIKEDKEKIFNYNKRDELRQYEEKTGYTVDTLKDKNLIDTDWGPFDTNDIDFKELNKLTGEDLTVAISNILELFYNKEIELSDEDLEKLQNKGK